MFLVRLKCYPKVRFKMFNNQFSVEGNKSERMMAISNMVTLVHAGKYSL